MPSERPPKKDRNFSVPIDRDLEQRAVKKAGSSSALRRVLRAFLFLWVEGEYPDPPNDVIEQTSRRAKKTPRKKG